MRNLVATIVIMLGIVLIGGPALAERIEIPEAEMAYVRQHGPDFAAAYQLLIEAPMDSYDYGPATAALRKLADEPALSEMARRDARFLLCVAEFCDLQFQDAAGDAARLDALVAQSGRPEDLPLQRLAGQVAEQCAAGRVDSAAQLRDVLYAGSCFKVLLPGKESEPLLALGQASVTLDCSDMLTKLRASKVYDTVAAKLADNKSFDAGCEPIVKLLRANHAHLQPVADRDFYATVGLLALEAGRLADKLPSLQNSLGLVACAHHMRQIGMALHLYLLDHQGKFPPSSVKHPATFEGKPAVVTEFYQDMLKPYLGLPAGDLVSSNGIYHTIPENSILQCPVYPPQKVGSLCHYGYGGATAVADSEKTLKFSAIQPGVQLLLADTCYFGARDSRGSSALKTQQQLCPRHGGYVNVLYADGRVCAADINWLWDSMSAGAPWDSRRPRVPRTDGKPWPFPIPGAGK